jgi:hypothetical protein
MGRWSNGVLEYWASNPSLHYSTTPLLQFPDVSAVKKNSFFVPFVVRNPNSASSASLR